MGRPKKAHTRFVCVGCFRAGSGDCGGLKCSKSRIVLNAALVKASEPGRLCHVCGSAAVSDCAHCSRRHFCAAHFEGVCRHCQDAHCSCEDLWTLRVSAVEPLGEWTVQDHLQLSIVLEGLRTKVVTKASIGIEPPSLDTVDTQPTTTALVTMDTQPLSALVVGGSTALVVAELRYKLSKSVEECEEYLLETDRKIRHERKVYLSYPIRRIVYSKLDKREIFQWPSVEELLVRSVYPRLHYRYSLPATLDKVTPEFAQLLERETTEAMKDCMYHRHRLFDLTPGAYDFNTFESSLVKDGRIHGKDAELWYMCKYRREYLRKTRCSVPLANLFRQPYSRNK